VARHSKTQLSLQADCFLLAGQAQSLSRAEKESLLSTALARAPENVGVWVV